MARPQKTKSYHGRPGRQGDLAAPQLANIIEKAAPIAAWFKEGAISDTFGFHAELLWSVADVSVRAMKSSCLGVTSSSGSRHVLATCSMRSTSSGGAKALGC
jgi:hypothetical protein